jgi:chromosome segregation ATPase
MIEPWDLTGASRHVRITCPHCQRSNLKIKRANLGSDVYCKQCGKGFRAELTDDPGGTDSSIQPAPGESCPPVPVDADRPRGAHGEDELQQIRAERDRLRALLGKSEADRLRLAEQAEELEALRTDRDRLDAAVRSGVAREEQLEARIQEVEWRAGGERDQAEDQRRIWQERLDAARLQIEQDRDQIAALVRRNEELAEQAQGFGTELDRLRRDREDEGRQQRMSLEALRNELEKARAEATDASDRAAATRAKLEGRLAEFEDRLRAAKERSQRFEGEMKARRDRMVALPSEGDSGQAFADAEREADRLRHQLEILVRERDAALRQIEDLGSDRDRLAGLLEQAEAAGREAARHEADAHRLARTIEQDRDQLAAMVRRNEELTEQTQGLETELDRLRCAREGEGRQQRMSLEALRHELENAQAEAIAASGRAAAVATARAKLEGRLAELEDRLGAASERSQQLEGEMQAQRDLMAALPSEGDSEQALADRLRIEELTALLDQTRAANEQLRSLLNVFGLVDHLGTGAGLRARE